MGGRSSKPPTPTSTSTPTISPTITIPDKSPHVVRSVNQSTTRHSMSQGMRSRSDRVASMNIQSSLFHSDDDSFDADDPLSTTSSHHDDTPHLPHLHPSHSNLKRISRRSSSFANCRNCNAVCIPRVVCHARHVYCGGDCYWSYTIRHESDQPHPVPRHNNTFADATPISQVLGDDSHVDGNVPVDVTDRWASKPEAVVQPMVETTASTLATSSTSSSSSSLRIHPQRHHRRTLSKKTDLNTIHSASPAPPVGTSPSLPMSSTSSSHLHIHPIVHDDESSDKSPQHTPHDDDMMMDHPSTSIHHDTTQHNTPEHEMNDETYDHFDPVSLSRTSAKMRHSISYQMMQPHNTSHQRRHSELVKSSSRPILIPTPTKPQPSPYLYVRT